MPLNEDEQRILSEIEQQFYESDPAFARGVEQTTLYRHAGRNLKWAAVGFIAGFALLVLAFASSLILGFIGFLAMLACAFFFERNLRVMGTGRVAAGHRQLSPREPEGLDGRRRQEAAQAVQERGALT